MFVNVTLCYVGKSPKTLHVPTCCLLRGFNKSSALVPYLLIIPFFTKRKLLSLSISL